ncbi:MAG: hypothetical protein HYX37_20275 [Rhizobiales bacterium]|nr:hypothetical protein [Hyphomicrobiales bacterium]
MITLPETQDVVALVDWLEASLLTQKAPRISDEAIIDVLSEADLDDPESLLASMQQTFRFRSRTVGEAYPFTRDGSGFLRACSWPDSLPYSFMLFASLNQSYVELTYAKGRANRPAELFEHLASYAIEKYLVCEVVRIGAPRRHPVPTQFPSALDYTVDRLGEIIGHRDLEDHASGDDGVDLIGWRPFGDLRASQAIIFAQCAIGTDWRDKRDGVNLDMWRQHINWHSPPLKGFAIPFHHQSGKPWRETAIRAGIIFDRLRIARLVPPGALPQADRRSMTEWCSKTRLPQVLKLNVDL